jgi:NAD(P)-dependent dehydrogenase (short-subunit alcohol dehydrogenase family)
LNIRALSQKHARLRQAGAASYNRCGFYAASQTPAVARSGLRGAGELTGSRRPVNERFIGTRDQGESSMRLENKYAIVTGGAGGIGLACAKRFVAEGARVLLTDINAAALDGALNGPPAGSVITRVCDSSRKDQVDAAVQAALAVFGRIDILVNNAGVVHAAEFLDLKEEDFDRVLAVNLKGYFLFGQAVARAMVAGKVAGSMINMSSVNAVLAIPNQVPYVVSKGGVNQLTKVMSLALAPHGIRVNGIGPGTIATELAKTAVLGSEEARKKILSRTPLGRLGEPEEIASIAAFLASEDASYMSGQTLYPDGGRLALNYTVAVAG